MTYAEKLKDPRWQKKRLEVFERDGWKCVPCGCGDQMLIAHHLYYDGYKDPWDYPLEALVTLCPVCNDFEHGKILDYEKMFREGLEDCGFLGRDKMELGGIIDDVSGQLWKAYRNGTTTLRPADQIIKVLREWSRKVEKP